jgi:hypothetical protein
MRYGKANEIVGKEIRLEAKGREEKRKKPLMSAHADSWCDAELSKQTGTYGSRPDLSVLHTTFSQHSLRGRGRGRGRGMKLIHW